MNRGLGLISIVLGIVVVVVGVLPTGWFGRLSGVGGSGHLTADVLVIIGVVLLVLGLAALLRSPAATDQLNARAGMNRRTEMAKNRRTEF
ncbi:MAG: hypothetical protein ACLQUY_18660 [Ktedonobacterales bacterium]